jgi:hypothetical protein
VEAACPDPEDPELTVSFLSASLAADVLSVFPQPANAEKAMAATSVQLNNFFVLSLITKTSSKTITLCFI